MPVVGLLVYAEIADDASRAKALEAVRKSLGFELAVTARWRILSATAGSSSRARAECRRADRPSSSPTTRRRHPGGRARTPGSGRWPRRRDGAAQRAVRGKGRMRRFTDKLQAFGGEPAELDPGSQPVRRLHAPRPRPQQHRLHVLRFLRIHERAGRHLQRDHGRLRRPAGRGHRLRPALRRDRQGRRLALGRAVAAARGLVSGGDIASGIKTRRGRIIC